MQAAGGSWVIHKGSGGSCAPGVAVNNYTYFSADVTIDGVTVENVGKETEETYQGSRLGGMRRVDSLGSSRREQGTMR